MHTLVRPRQLDSRHEDGLEVGLEVLARDELPLWPNLEGSEDAPATANRGEEKKVFSAASISTFRFDLRVVGIYLRSVVFSQAVGAQVPRIMMLRPRHVPCHCYSRVLAT
jgi:hypothetical protein